MQSGLEREAVQVYRRPPTHFECRLEPVLLRKLVKLAEAPFPDGYGN